MFNSFISLCSVNLHILGSQSRMCMVIFCFVKPLEIDTVLFLCNIRNFLTGLPKGFYCVNNNYKVPFFVNCIFLREGQVVYMWEEWDSPAWRAQAAIPAFQFLTVCQFLSRKKLALEKSRVCKVGWLPLHCYNRIYDSTAVVMDLPPELYVSVQWRRWAQEIPLRPFWKANSFTVEFRI